MKHEILAIIPARGGSKGIPRKNLIELCGKPLIQYTVDAANDSSLISRILLSSDDDEIIEYCLAQGVGVPFSRPAELASDDSPMIDVIIHSIDYLLENENYKPDYVILLQPTSPLRTGQHIDEALGRLIKSEADSIVSVVELPHRFNPFSIMKPEGDYLKPFLEFDERKNLRQLKPKFYARNGAAIYAFTYDCLKLKNSIYGDKILPYLMKEEESIDIDGSFDLRICEYILKMKRIE